MPTSVAFKDESAMVVVLASKGYPEAYPKGETITEPSDSPEGSVLIHAGTKEQDGEIVTAGGKRIGSRWDRIDSRTSQGQGIQIGQGGRI